WFPSHRCSFRSIFELSLQRFPRLSDLSNRVAGGLYIIITLQCMRSSRDDKVFVAERHASTHSCTNFRAKVRDGRSQFVRSGIRMKKTTRPASAADLIHHGQKTFFVGLVYAGILSGIINM